MKKKLLLLYSGGLDSTVLLCLALDLGYEITCLIFNYGQRHEKETEFAMEQCSKRAVKYVYVTIPTLSDSVLTGQNKRYEGVSQWHVPARNMLFTAYAASLAESQGIDLIWYGANYADRENVFPDCTQEWVYQMNKLLQINGSRPIKLEAPLLGMQKETIEKLAEAYQINKNEIFSGYGE